MRAFIALAIASLAIAACTYQSNTVEHRTPSGTVVTESSGVRPIGTVEIHDGS